MNVIASNQSQRYMEDKIKPVIASIYNFEQIKMKLVDKVVKNEDSNKMLQMKMDMIPTNLSGSQIL
jgi:hypothetical protein